MAQSGRGRGERLAQTLEPGGEAGGAAAARGKPADDQRELESTTCATHGDNLLGKSIFVSMNESATRVEAFSDGVFAIAITLLILEIRVPHGDGGLAAGLIALWPSYIAFLLSFVVILIMWVNHHELLRMVRTVNYPFLFANGVLLLTVTFVPFPTAVLAANLATPDAKASVAFYCATFVAQALGWNLLFATMVRGGVVRGGGAGGKGRKRRPP